MLCRGHRSSVRSAARVGGRRRCVEKNEGVTNGEPALVKNAEWRACLLPPRRPDSRQLAWGEAGRNVGWQSGEEETTATMQYDPTHWFRQSAPKIDKVAVTRSEPVKPVVSSRLRMIHVLPHGTLPTRHCYTVLHETR